MSTTISVTRRVESSASDFYELFADTAKFQQVKGLRVELLEPGNADGVGVLRRVRMGAGLVLVERIVALNPRTHTFGYLLKTGNPRVTHVYGQISFTPEGEGTAATWTSRVSISVGPFTGIAEVLTRGFVSAAFWLALGRLDRYLQTRRPTVKSENLR
ncbi:SRPBCC family protein [Mycobacteroides chelonae]|jgi:hypothetical protein|uniref:SRPBCC family protein n=1 Tax=Mycobacteroides chelonae TaxID=1774 RepID=UPI0008A89E12|nr:SRPBCC family protein [Mycobacteroides chelonae]MBF9326947.1 SRPBCC family protein [Mycobacteroides chelonae]MBF9421124.1 SRPBCC family protein [Mycobacteroides chelonae]MBF9436685.1 SRPBCC family protein [Mycobacteroides chelonae]MBV6361026.1 SRPBCC family protein [Mycobacteroides chelonae]MEC4833465.1 SRPBCC family protein [Mycobacteroides chelonae]